MLRDVVRFVSVVAIVQVAFFQMFFSRLGRVKFKFVFTLFLFFKKKISAILMFCCSRLFCLCVFSSFRLHQSLQKFGLVLIF